MNMFEITYIGSDISKTPKKGMIWASSIEEAVRLFLIVDIGYIIKVDAC